MEIVLLIARLFLAVVFCVAGIAKIADLKGSRKATVDFGLPERLAAPLAWGLPLIELLIAAALIPLNTAWWGATGALAVLLIFIAGISANIARGQSPDCHCFGQLHSAPVGWSTLTRNLALAAVAGLIIIQGKENPGLSALGWMAELKAGEIVILALAAVAVALLAAAVVYLRRILDRQSTVLERIEVIKKVIDEDYADPLVEREDAAAPIEGLPIGAPAPSFSLASINGQQVTLDGLLARGKPVLLLFVSPTCSPCKMLLPLVKVWERDYEAQLTVALISKGELKENINRMGKYGVKHLLLQGESDVDKDYQASWTPAAVVIGRDGIIRSHVTYGDEAIRALVAYAVTTSEVQATASNGGGNGHRPKITIGTSLFKVGDPAPRFSLPDLHGKMVDAEDLLGRDTLLLFWNPTCGFCQAMSEDIKRWEESPPMGAPRLVIISSGDAKSVKANSRDFKSLFLHDPEFDMSPLFGTNSTPSAVLIGADGTFASSLAVGERNILPLLGVRKVELPIASIN